MKDTYFGLFRISEVTTTASMHVIKVKDVHIGQNKKKILFILHSSKTHGEYSRPQMVKINSKLIASGKTNQSYCPFANLHEYIQQRPHYLSPQEPFFVVRDNTPVTAYHMRSTLKIMLQVGGFEEQLYTCHSLRGGRAQDLLKCGISVETIKKLGRWKSNIVYVYLK